MYVHVRTQDILWGGEGGERERGERERKGKEEGKEERGERETVRER